MVREEYEALMRPYYDSTQAVLVRWYRAHPTAELARPWTRFGASSRSPNKTAPVGEVVDLENYTRGSWGNFGGWLGKRVCEVPGGFQRGVSINQPPIPCKCAREPVIPVQEVPAGLVDGVNRIFTLTFMPISNNSCLLFVNGVAQTQGVDYSLTGPTINFAAASRPLVKSTVLAYYWVATP